MQSYWIWTYGDYEIYHSNLANSKRQEYGADYPVFWKLFDVDRNVKLYNEFYAETDGTMKLKLNGKGYIMLDGERYAENKDIHVSKGKHEAYICVMNLTGLPAAYIESDVCATNGDWYTFDENYSKVSVGYDEKYDSAEKNPETFPFAYEHIQPVSVCEKNGGMLFDFGKELFGYLLIDNVKASDKLHVSYGESEEESLDTDFSILSTEIVPICNFPVILDNPYKLFSLNLVLFISQCLNWLLSGCLICRI